MRIGIAAIGRMKSGPERDLVARYLERAQATGKPLGLTGFEISEFPESRASSSARRKLEEARVLGSTYPEKSLIIALDETGKSTRSEQFAHWIGDWRDNGRPALTFIIGGADGLDPDARARADKVLSFSPLTWPHQLVRIMLAEQLYRANTILGGHPYHRGD